MTYQPRKRSGTGIYHVMFRGINRQDIFEDDDIRNLLNEDFGKKAPKDIQKLPKQQRDIILNTVCDLGATIRQTARLTGISFGVIQKLRKHEIQM